MTNSIELCGLLLCTGALTMHLFGGHTVHDVLLTVGAAIFWLQIGLRSLLLRPALGPLVLATFRMLDDVSTWIGLVALFTLTFAFAFQRIYADEYVAILHTAPVPTNDFGLRTEEEQCTALVAGFGESVWRAALLLLHVLLDPGEAHLDCFEVSGRWLSGTVSGRTPRVRGRIPCLTAGACVARRC